MSIPAAATQGYATDVARMDEDAALILALWREGLTQRGMPEAKLEWYYRRNAEGLPQVYFLRHVDSPGPVGVASVVPRRMRARGHAVRGGLLADFVVQPDHRSFFPALFLQREMRRRSEGAYDVLFGFPNPRSLAIVKRVGYRSVGPMERRVRVLRSREYLARKLPAAVSGPIGVLVDAVRRGGDALRRLASGGFRSGWVEAPDASFDALWDRAADPEVVTGVRDSEFLAWRFAECPLHQYTFFVLRRGGDDALAAYAVCEAQEAQQTLTVCDFLVDPQVPNAAARLWLDLSREAFRMGMRSLSVQFLGSARIRGELEEAGLATREQRPLHVAFLAGEAGLRGRDWYVTLADEDG
jgi:hypothetical protein